LVDLIEAFVVCQNYTPPEGYTPTMANPLMDFSYGKNVLVQLYELQMQTIIKLTRMN